MVGRLRDGGKYRVALSCHVSDMRKYASLDLGIGIVLGLGGWVFGGLFRRCKIEIMVVGCDGVGESWPERRLKRELAEPMQEGKRKKREKKKKAN